MASSGKGVLIVDDNVLVRATLRRFVEQTAHLQVCGEAGDGKEAVEETKKVHPELVLMDISMPKMNGIDAASAIHRMAPETRIILFSLHGDSVIKTIAKSAQADCIISKSEGTSALIEALQRLLPDTAH